MKILCPVDFTDITLHAVKWAIEFASRLNGSLILFHSVHVGPVLPGDYVYDLPDLDGQVELAKDQLENLCEIHLNKNSHERVDIGFKVSVGFALDEIAKVIDNEDINLLVMATHGDLGLETKILGTNTSKLLKKLAIPVIVLPIGVDYTDIKSIIYATELEEREIRSVQYVVALAKKLEATVHVIHVNGGVLSESKLHNFQRIIDGASGESIEIKVLNGTDITDSIEQFMETQSNQLLSLTSYKRTLLEAIGHKSITRSSILHPKVPVLIISAQSNEQL